MTWQIIVDSLESSYKANNLGWVFYSLVRIFQPRFCIEVGVYQGYSALFTLAGLRDNQFGYWTGYDLFDDYPYKHTQQTVPYTNIIQAGLSDYVGDLKQMDLQAAPQDLGERMVDFCHIDVSNTGHTIQWCCDRFAKHINTGGLLLFEGGSQERDEVQWMQDYNKQSIRLALLTVFRNSSDWELFVQYSQFPSLTVLRRR